MHDSWSRKIINFWHRFVLALHPLLAPLHHSVAWLLVVVFVVQLFHPTPRDFAASASYTFNQSSWSGGASTGNVTYPVNVTTTYSSAANISAGANLQLAPSSTAINFGARADVTAQVNVAGSVPNNGGNHTVITNTSTGVMYVAYYSNEFNSSFVNIALRTSTDGGLTWGARRDVTTLINSNVYNPSLAFDSFGNLYMTYDSYEYSTGHYNIALRTSSDSGLTWGAKRDVTTISAGSGNANGSTIIFDSVGSIYVIYKSTEFNATYENTALRTSTNGGLTWGARRDVTTITSGCCFAYEPVIARDAANNLYVAYYSGEFNTLNNIALRTSTNGGLTWGARRDVTTNTSGGSQSPSLVIDSLSNIYVSYSGSGSGEFSSSFNNIALRTSTNGGLTWGGRIDVTTNTDIGSTFPITTKDVSDNIFILYRSMEYSGLGNLAVRGSNLGNYGNRKDVTVSILFDSYIPKIVFNTSTGVFYLSYYSYEKNSNATNIALRTSTDGGLTWGERRDVTTSTAVNSLTPSVIFDSSNNLYVAYSSREFDSSYDNIALRTSTDGGLTWGSRRDVTAAIASGDALYPSLSRDSSNNLFVAYYSTEFDVSNWYYNIAIRTSTDNGLTWGARRDVTANTTFHSQNPSLIQDSLNNLYVAYYSKEFNSTYYNIALRTTTNGGLTWGDRRDVTANGSGESLNPSLSLDSLNNLYVAYHSYEFDSSYHNIAARTSTDGGLTWGARRDVSANASGDALGAFLVPDASGNLYVSYYSYEFNASFYNIAVRTSTNSGLTWGARIDLSTSTIVDQTSPAIALDSSNNINVGYVSKEFVSTTSNIAFRRAAGISYFVTGTITSAPFDSGSTGNAIEQISWQENRTLPSGTTLTASVRTATSSASLSNAAWTDFGTTSGTWKWAKRLGGTGGDSGRSVRIDSANNIILTGKVTGDVDVNGDGDSTDDGAESSTGYGSTDIIISIFNSSGVWQWAKRLGGTGSDEGYSVSIDTASNIIVTGWVVGDSDVNGDGDSTDGGAESATGYGSTDIIISVFNSSGVWQWAKRLGGTGSDVGYSINTDSANNIILTGQITGDSDVNGDGDATDGGAESATGYGSTDIIISVFNSSGVWQWAKRLGGTGSDVGYSINTDSTNNIIVTGFIVGNSDVNGDGDSTDGGAESSTGYGSIDIIVSVFNSSGTWQWAKRLGGTSNDEGYGVSTDSANNVIVTGWVVDNSDVNGDGDSTDGGAESSTGYGSIDIIVSVFNSSGTWQWAKRLGGTSNDEGYGVSTDSANNIIVTGYIIGNSDVNGDGDSTDGGAESGSGYGSSDAIISVFNSSGVWQWGKRLGGTGNDIGFGVSIDSNNNIFLAGQVTGDADINGNGILTDGGAENSSGYGSTDIIISVFSSNGTCSKSSGTVTCGASAIPALMKDGVDDQVWQYKLAMSGGVSSPTLTSLAVNYGTPDPSVPAPGVITDNPPTIGTVTAVASSTSATVTWSATDDHQVTTSSIVYGLTTSYGLSGAVINTYRSTLLGLTPSTTYFYRVSATDNAGQSTAYTSSFITASSTVTTTTATTTSTATTATTTPSTTPTSTTTPTTTSTTTPVTTTSTPPTTSTTTPVTVTSTPVTTVTTTPASSTPTPVIPTETEEPAPPTSTPATPESVSPPEEATTTPISGGVTGEAGGIPTVGGLPSGASAQESGAVGGFIDSVISLVSSTLSETEPITVKEVIALAADLDFSVENISNFTEAISKMSIRQAAVASKEIIESAIIIKEISDNPKVEKITRQVVAPVTAGASLAISIPSFVSVALPLSRYLFLQPLLFLGIRRRKNWGKVYNSLNKLPIGLATLRLINVVTGRVVQTRVTDPDGHYGFFVVEPGEYKIEVVKNDFIFPSKLLAKDDVDGIMTDIYHGQNISLNQENVNIAVNIPIDPIEQTKTPAGFIFERKIRIAQNIFSLSGALLMFVYLLVSNTWYIWIFLTVHISLYILFLKFIAPRKLKGWGTVYDIENKNPIYKTVVRLFTRKYNKMVDFRVTDKKGRYAFLVGPSDYFVTFEREGYEGGEGKEFDLTETKEEKILIKDDTWLKPSDKTVPREYTPGVFGNLN